MESKSVTVINYGPIIHHQAVLRPGVNIARGANAVGKSTFVACVSALATGGTLPANVTDGADRAQVEGIGRVIKIKAKATAIGTPDAPAIDGGSVAKLVDPGLKSQDAANAARIKELARLRNVKLSTEEIVGVIGRDTVDPVTLSAVVGMPDPVEAVAALKRTIEEQARDHERRADKLAAECDSLFRMAQFDGDPISETAARKKMETALAAKAAIEERSRLARESGAKVAAARAALDGLGDIEGSHLEHLLADQESIAREAEAAMEAARQKLEFAHAKATELRRRIAERDRRIKEKSDLSAVLESAAVAPPTEEERAGAEKAVEDAGAAVKAAAAFQMAEQSKEQAQELAKVLAKAREAGNSLRRASKSLDGVLTAAIGGGSLEVRDGLLWWRGDDRRKAEPFHRLSDGFRWRIALEEVSRIHAGAHAILAVEQPAWEGLDQSNRRLVHELAEKCNVYLITAEADDGPLRVEHFTAETANA